MRALCLLLVLVVVVACTAVEEPTAVEVAESTPPTAVNTTYDAATRVYSALELHALLGEKKKGELTLVNFQARWCKFSKQFEPIFNASVLSFPTVQHVFFDASNDSSRNIEYGVFAFPTILLFNSSKRVSRFGIGIFEVRAVTLSDMVDFIQKHTSLVAVPDIAVVEYPPYKWSPDADIFTYVAAIFLLFLIVRVIEYAKNLWRAPVRPTHVKTQ